MRNRYIKLAILMVFVILTFTGCWDSVSIEKKDITTAVLVDKTDNGYAFYIEIASIAGSSTGEEAQQTPRSKMLVGEGETFVDAREELERKSDKPVSLFGVQCVIFTEKFAYSGIEEYMYRFRQNPEYRKTALAVVTRENPEDLFGAASENNTLIGLTVNDTLQSQVDTGYLYPFTMGDLLTVLACPYKGYLLPCVDLDNNKEPMLDGFCVMDGSNCLGYIPIEDSESIVYIRNNMSPFHYALPYAENNITLELHLKKSGTDVSYNDGQIQICLHFTCKANLLYMSDNLTVDEAVRQKITDELKNKLTEEYKKVIETSQKIFKCDYLKFHESFRIKYPEQYKDMDWSEEYQKATITVDFSVEVVGGNIDYEPK